MKNYLITNAPHIFLVLAFFVLGLSIYLGILFGRVRLQKKSILALKALDARKSQEREISILESIEIISKGVIQDQCEISEGCLRIKKLKDQLVFLNEDLDLEVFDKMYEEIEGFDILEARKTLSNQERFNQDKKRFKVENEYKDRIKEACIPLLSYVKTKLKKY